MAHEFHKEDVRTGYEKVRKMTGDTKRFQHPTEKAGDLAYYENEHLDHMPLPTTEKVGP